MKARFDAVVAGHICIDVIPHFLEGSFARLEEVIVPGRLLVVGPAVTATGGAVPNTGLALIRLGIHAKLMGKIGDDFFGRGILEILRPYHAEDGMAVVAGESSSYTFVFSPPTVDRIFLHHPGANDTFGADDVDYDLVRSSRLFHLGYPPLMKRLMADDGAELTEIFRRCRDLGVTTSLDMSLPDPTAEAGRADWDKILRNTLPFVDIFLPSAEEILFMLDRGRFEQLKARSGDQGLLEQLGPDEVARLAETLLGCGAKVAVIKCGHKGLYAATGGREQIERMGAACAADPDNWAQRELWEESFHVDRIATATGAGDCTIAGFLASLLRGESIEMSLRCACAVGAQNVAAMDAVSGVKCWEETQAMVAAVMPKNRLDIGSARWRFDQTGGLWIGSRDRGF